MNILILGASGMLGNAMFRLLAGSPGFDVYGTVRSPSSLKFFDPALAQRLDVGVDVENPDSLSRILERRRPQAVINCVGVVKQIADANDPLTALPINAMLPHRLANLCGLLDARLVHVSTDCVFSGDRGGYRETDPSDAGDLYGKSKYIGEVDRPHAITLRTSIIGHELSSAHGLVNWFLAQSGSVKGYSKAIFSGLPTIELAHVVRDVILPRPDMHGLYHVASAPISKHDLLCLIARVYGKTIDIVPDDHVRIDRSLDASRFSAETGYVAPTWPELIERMHAFQ